MGLRFLMLLFLSYSRGRRCAHGAEVVDGDHFSTLTGGRGIIARSSSEGGSFGDGVVSMQGTRLVKWFAGTSWGVGDSARCLNVDHFWRSGFCRFSLVICARM